MWQQKAEWGVHGLALATVVTMAATQLDGTLFRYHPVTMSLGFVLMMTEAILGAIKFRNHSGEERVRRITAHMLMNFAGVASIIVGFATIYVNKNRLGKMHYTSTHGKLGLAVFIMSILLLAVGLVSFRKLGVLQFFPDSLQKLIKRAHRLGGLTCYVLVIVTIELGLQSPSMNTGQFIEKFWQFSVVVVGLLLLALAFAGFTDRNRFKQARVLVSEMELHPLDVDIN